jgi:hypothetical protein
LKLFLGFYQQKLLETVPLWSGYVSWLEFLNFSWEVKRSSTNNNFFLWS